MRCRSVRPHGHVQWAVASSEESACVIATTALYDRRSPTFSRSGTCTFEYIPALSRTMTLRRNHLRTATTDGRGSPQSPCRPAWPPPTRSSLRHSFDSAMRRIRAGHARPPRLRLLMRDVTPSMYPAQDAHRPRITLGPLRSGRNGRGRHDGGVVRRTLSTKSFSAPSLIRSRTTSAWPFSAAQINGE